MLYNKYKIRIVYKSGYHHDFWCYQFTIKQNGSLHWWAVSLSNSPVCIADSTESIESIWTVDKRRGILGDKK